MTHTKDRYAAIIIIAGALVLLALLWRAPAGAAMLPRAVLLLATALAVIMYVRAWLTDRVPATPAQPPSPEAPRPFFIDPRRFAIALLAIALYVFAIRPLGFYLASFIFICAAAFVLGERRPLLVFGTALGFLMAAYLLFSVLLMRPMPPPPFLSQSSDAATVLALARAFETDV